MYEYLAIDPARGLCVQFKCPGTGLCGDKAQHINGGDPGSNHTALNGTNATVPPKPPLYSNPCNIDYEQFSAAGRYTSMIR